MMVLISAIAAFIGMEGASWWIHKYIMHGPLWKIHKTHHVHGKSFFELNDVFSLFFGSIAVVLLVVGLSNNNPFATGAGIGISLYGLVYFVLHDILIHRRLKIFKRTGNTYLQGLADAHRKHHSSRERDGAVVFGLLCVPFRYFNQQKKKGSRA